MKSEILIHGMEILVVLDEKGKIEIPEFEKESKIKGSELKELLKYLDKKGYLKYQLGLFVNDSKISDSTIELLPKGMEVVLGQRDYFDEMGTSQTIHNQTNLHDSPNSQVAQTTGDDSSITQIQDNSKITILKQLIADDKELNEPKKKKLFGILEKFNTLKESGENAYELIKQAGLISIKYVPLFFGLLK